MVRILFISPYTEGSGNRTTANRIKRFIESLGHIVTVIDAGCPPDSVSDNFDAAILLHAYKSGQTYLQLKLKLVINYNQTISSSRCSQLVTIITGKKAMYGLFTMYLLIIGGVILRNRRRVAVRNYKNIYGKKELQKFQRKIRSKIMSEEYVLKIRYTK